MPDFTFFQASVHTFLSRMALSFFSACSGSSQKPGAVEARSSNSISESFRSTSKMPPQRIQALIQRRNLVRLDHNGGKYRKNSTRGPLSAEQAEKTALLTPETLIANLLD
jgi:hypothetical protein